MAKVETLQELFELELQDMYDAERQITKALPKVIKHTTDQGLRGALEHHLQQTHEQVRRLEQVFTLLGQKAKTVTCDGMKGILEEGEEVLGKCGNEAIRDAAIVAACQRVEHYETAVYGTLCAWGQALGLNPEAVSLMRDNEKEEIAADRKLTELASASINKEAMAVPAA